MSSQTACWGERAVTAGGLLQGGERRLVECVAAGHRDHVVGLDVVRRHLVDRLAEGDAEHRDAGDEGEPDRQCGRGGSGTPRVADRVLRGQLAGDPEHPQQQRAHQGDHGAGEQRDQDDDADQGQEGAAREEKLTVRPGLCRACHDNRAAEQGDDAADRVAQHQGLHRGHRVLAVHRRDRRDLRGPAGGQPGGQHGDQDADAEGGDDGERRDHQRSGRDLSADQAHRGAQSGGEAEAQGEADDGRDQAHHGRFDQHRALDLAARGADGAQQCQLLGALGDQHGEGVGDQEDADEEGDAREGEQQLVEAAQGGLGLVGLLVRARLAGLGLGVLGQQRLDGGQYLLVGGAGGGGDGDVPELARPQEQLLGDGGVEQDQAAAAC